MQKILKCIITFFSITIIFTLTSLGLENTNGDKECWINNDKEDKIRIEILDVDVMNEEIKISEDYVASAVLTINVTNCGIYDMELSDIDIMPYQGHYPTKYFVSTSEDKITGFIGNIKSNESKIVKIGVALHNVKDPIRLEIDNISSTSNEKLIENITIK